MLQLLSRKKTNQVTKNLTSSLVGIEVPPEWVLTDRHVDEVMGSSAFREDTECGRLAARTTGLVYSICPLVRARSTFACSRVPQGEHTLIPFREVRSPAACPMRIAR